MKRRRKAAPKQRRVQSGSQTSNTRHRGPNPFSGDDATFAEAFPDVEAVSVNVTQYRYDDLGRGQPFTTKLTKERVGRYVRCENPRCHKGGFDLQTMLNGMMASRQTEAASSAICEGTERSPKGRKAYGPCGNHFTVNALVAYKTARKVSE